MRIARKRMWFGVAGFLFILWLANSLCLMVMERRNLGKLNVEKLHEGMTIEEVEHILGSRGTIPPPWRLGQSPFVVEYCYHGVGPGITIIAEYSSGKLDWVLDSRETFREWLERLKDGETEYRWFKVWHRSRNADAQLALVELLLWRFWYGLICLFFVLSAFYFFRRKHRLVD
jgi:hypothetical protein